MYHQLKKLLFYSFRESKPEVYYKFQLETLNLLIVVLLSKKFSPLQALWIFLLRLRPRMFVVVLNHNMYPWCAI
jgi:hypothetical protein